jgi:integrase-like protein
VRVDARRRREEEALGARLAGGHQEMRIDEHVEHAERLVVLDESDAPIHSVTGRRAAEPRRRKRGLLASTTFREAPDRRAGQDQARPAPARPYVSNDNPYSEAHFKTLKYRPAFPDCFGSLQDARVHGQSFFTSYNTEHHHSGLGLLTPHDVHHGLTEQRVAARATVLAAAYAAHPEPVPRRAPSAAGVPHRGLDQPTQHRAVRAQASSSTRAARLPTGPSSPSLSSIVARS